MNVRTNKVVKIITEDELELIRGHMYDQGRLLAPKLEKIYSILEWKWHDILKVPTKNDIKLAVLDLCSHLKAGETEYLASSGGLTAWYQVESEEQDRVISYGIKFELGEEIETRIGSLK